MNLFRPFLEKKGDHGSPIFVLYRNREKMGFPMPAAENGFQILNLHPKKHKTFINGHLLK